MKNVTLLSILAGLLLAPLAWAADAPTTRPAVGTGDDLFTKILLKPFTDMIDKKDPLGHIAGEMESSKGMLADLRTSKPTQAVQQNIIADLDDFIAMLEKQKKTAKAGSGGGTPLPDSVLAGGPGGQGDMHDPNASARLWGQLPPKQREQILQSQMQGFPAGYESILSSYYKWLAQENVSDSSNNAPTPAAPATQPAR